MKKEYTLYLISIYKLVISITRLTIGFFILYFKGNLENLMSFLLRGQVLDITSSIIKQPVIYLAYILAWILIVYGIFEIVFATALIYRKKWGAIGLFIFSFLWIPVEILFVSKFLLVHEIIAILINIIILILLFRMIKHPKKYFD